MSLLQDIVSFIGLFCKKLQKRPVILRSLLIVATPYMKRALDLIQGAIGLIQRDWSLYQKRALFLYQKSPVFISSHNTWKELLYRVKRAQNWMKGALILIQRALFLSQKEPYSSIKRALYSSHHLKHEKRIQQARALLSCHISSRLNQKSPEFCRKSLRFYQKSPGFHQKSPMFYQNNPVFVSNEPHVLSEEPWIASKEPHLLFKTTLFLYQKSPMLYQKSRVLQCVSVCCSALKCGAVCWSACGCHHLTHRLCVAVCFSVL